MLLVKVVPIDSVVSQHQYACMRCDYVRDDPTLEKIKPAGGWIIEPKIDLTGIGPIKVTPIPRAK
jgi:hypothetical protein